MVLVLLEATKFALVSNGLADRVLPWKSSSIYMTEKFWHEWWRWFELSRGRLVRVRNWLQMSREMDREKILQRFRAVLMMLTIFEECRLD